MSSILTLTLLLSLWLLPVGFARGAAVDVLGADGSPGAPGVSGNPPTDGQDGGDGESATAVSDGPDASNLAGARGGDGGSGGDGGDSVGYMAGDGGAGGAGGDAQALASTSLASGNTSVVAEANGGVGGSGGAHGSGAIPANDGADGARGPGGDALADARAQTAAGRARAEAEAIGGYGVPTGAGTATARASAVGTVDGSAFARAVGGSGSIGGSADARAHGSTLEGELFVGVDVFGGEGHGSETSPGIGASVELVDAATGSGPDLTLSQRAFGGFADGPGARGGDARSLLQGVETGAERLELRSHAIGGSVGWEEGDPIRGGDASAGASVIDHHGTLVVMEVIARAGSSAGPGSVGGAASIEAARVESTAGADVFMTIRAEGGSGDVAPDVDLDDVAEVVTTGFVTIEQYAESRSNARSRLHHSGSFEALVLDGTARGEGATTRADVRAENDAGRASATALAVGEGGGDSLSRAEAISRDNAANVRANSRAEAGFAGATSGGDAESESIAHGESVGDVDASSWAQGGALGGTGGFVRSSAVATGTNSGRVTAGAVGIDFSDGDVEARAEAFGSLQAAAGAFVLGFGNARAESEAHSGSRIARVRTLVEQSPPATQFAQHYSYATVADGQVSAESAFSFLLQGAGGVALSALPLAADVPLWLDGNPNASSAAEDGEVLALGWTIGATGGSPLEGSTELSLALDGFADDAVLSLAFLDSFTRETAETLPFEFFHLRLADGDDTLFEVEFTDLEAALASLDDAVFALGTIESFGDELAELVLTVEVNAGSRGLATEFALLLRPAVPEPALAFAALALLAALALARRDAPFRTARSDSPATPCRGTGRAARA